MWYRGPKAIRDAIDHAKFSSRSRDAAIRVYDEAGNVIETHEHGGDFKGSVNCSWDHGIPSIRQLPPKNAAARRLVAIFAESRHLIEIISRLYCLVHLRIWNGTKERNTDTATWASSSGAYWPLVIRDLEHSPTSAFWKMASCPALQRRWFWVRVPTVDQQITIVLTNSKVD